MFKFKVGDLVSLKSLRGKVGGEKSFKIMLAEEGQYYNWYKLDCGFNYREEQLELVHRKPIEIVPFYRVEDVEFDTIDEAKKHLKKVQLFELLGKDLDDETKGILENLLDPIIQNSNEIVNILK